jgi:hypothetical protein
MCHTREARMVMVSTPFLSVWRPEGMERKWEELGGWMPWLDCPSASGHHDLPRPRRGDAGGWLHDGNRPGSPTQWRGSRGGILGDRGLRKARRMGERTQPRGGGGGGGGGSAAASDGSVSRERRSHRSQPTRWLNSHLVDVNSSEGAQDMACP